MSSISTKIEGQRFGRALDAAKINPIGVVNVSLIICTQCGFYFFSNSTVVEMVFESKLFLRHPKDTTFFLSVPFLLLNIIHPLFTGVITNC